MKILIVDDHPLVLNAMVELLNMPGTEILAAPSLRHALDVLGANPDAGLIILDLALPDSAGMDALVHLRQIARNTPILILSGNGDKESIRIALEFGARGYVPKTTAVNELKQAVELVLAGGIYMPAEFTELGDLAASGAGTQGLDLTPREREILELLILGLSNKHIAKRLDLSPNTVRVHAAHIMRKLGVSSRAQVISRFLLGSS